MRPADKAPAAVPLQLKDQAKFNSSTSTNQVRVSPGSVEKSESEIRSKDVNVKGTCVEESLRMMVFLGSWGPN